MKKEMKYEGSWSANNSSIYGYGYRSNNKKQLASDMRKIAKGNVFLGNRGYWAVYEIIDGERSYNPILSGMVR